MAAATVPLLSDDDTIPFGEENDNLIGPDGTRKLTHPYVTFFHIFFRTASIVVYILCGWLLKSFITSFVCLVLLLSADFWTVKNITGRLLVGLRWWNYVDDQGVSHWVYEARKGTLQGRVNPREARLFWLALILCPSIWSILFIIALFGFNFKWMLLVLIALTLNGANLFGYIKCKYGGSTNLGTVTTDFFKKQLVQNAFNMLRPAKPTSAQPTGVI